jgi:prepilin-type N-terminal cleavage/methylation domain-containing protein
MKRTRAQRTAGFTLIELLVVMAIMALLMGVIIDSHSKFGGKILLRTLTFDTALTIRQAQTYGISVRQSTSGSSAFIAGYGVQFKSSTPTQFILFSDVSGNDGIYSAGADTAIQTFSISRGYTINRLCTITSGTETCGATQLDLVFRRPEPDAEIRINNVSSTIYQKARIEMKSPRGDLQSIIVEVSGQISIQ